MSHFSESYIPNLTGTHVDSGYLKLVKLLSTGQSSRVYKAVDTTSYEQPGGPAFYAVKCVRTPIKETSMASIVRRELRCHRAVSALHGVAPFLRTFKHGPFLISDEFLFIVMDLCPGGNLGDAIDRGVYVDKPVLTRTVFVELADALKECHAQGVYHGDLNPENVLLKERRKDVRLTDFGLASRLEEACGGTHGDMAYLSPERVNSIDSASSTYSPRSDDLWALAVTLFAMLTGTTPWLVARPKDLLYAAFLTNPEGFFRKTFPNLPSEASDLFVRCFNGDPKMRPALKAMRREVRRMRCLKGVKPKGEGEDEEATRVSSFVTVSLSSPTPAPSPSLSSEATVSLAAAAAAAATAPTPSPTLSPQWSVSSSAYSLLDAPNVDPAPLVPTRLQDSKTTTTTTPTTPVGQFHILTEKSRRWLTDRLRRMGLHRGGDGWTERKSEKIKEKTG